MATVEMKSLRKTFGGTVALEELDLAIESGEFVSLLGPSGCGKTTALRIVAGFDWPDQGEVWIDGVEVVGMPASRRNMGMVFQAYSLFPHLSARQNVEFGLQIRRRPAAQRRAKSTQLLELVGLTQVADHYPAQLSGGQQQRVALARAIAIEPSVLLLDEPLSALDAKVRLQLREEVRRIQRQLGITTIFVTHDQEEALSISDRVAIMSKGRLEQVAPPVAIYASPRTSFVAEFVGTMSQLEGEVAGTGVQIGGTRLDGAAKGVARPAGSAVKVFVRPEAVRVEALAEGAAPSPGGWEGAVESQTFLGATSRLRIRTPVGPLLADLPTAAATQLRPGARVGVRLDQESGVHVLAA